MWSCDIYVKQERYLPSGVSRYSQLFPWEPKWMFQELAQSFIPHVPFRRDETGGGDGGANAALSVVAPGREQLGQNMDTRWRQRGGPTA